MLNQEYLNRRQLKDLFGISYSTIHRKFKNFPRLKLGEAFPRPAIDQFIEREFKDKNSDSVSS